MYKGKRTLAIITARGGSKGLPGKNIKICGGKPLVAWTIEAAKGSEFLDTLYISTDSREIADVCEKYGAPVPELRPDELAKDSTPSVDVILYTIESLEKREDYYDYVLLLEPTSPLRKKEDIDQIIRIAVDNPDSDGCISVGRVHTEHPSIIKKVDKNGFIIPYIDNIKEIYQRQLEDDAFFPYGVGYLIKPEVLKQQKTIYTKHMLPYYIERWQNYEIDDLYDLKIVESIMDMEGWL